MRFEVAQKTFIVVSVDVVGVGIVVIVVIVVIVGLVGTNEWAITSR